MCYSYLLLLLNFVLLTLYVCFSVEGWCVLKKEFALCPSRKTSLRNAIYGSEFSDDVITIPY